MTVTCICPYCEQTIELEHDKRADRSSLNLSLSAFYLFIQHFADDKVCAGSGEHPHLDPRMRQSVVLLPIREMELA